jgi:hypothetical protein
MHVLHKTVAHAPRESSKTAKFCEKFHNICIIDLAGKARSGGTTNGHQWTRMGGLGVYGRRGEPRMGTDYHG